MPRHRYDVVPSLPDHRDFLSVAPMGTLVPYAAQLPYVPPIKNQGNEGSCTGVSLSSAREADWVIKGNDYVEFSPAMIYYEERRIEGTTGSDNGAMIRDGLKVLLHEGVCPEEVMPYTAGAYTQPPPPNVVDAAEGYKIKEYRRVGLLLSVEHAILEKHPVVFGISVYESFEHVGADGKVPMPALNEQLLGGHAILCVGYRRDKRAPGGGWFVMNNSWGTGEGDSGKFYIPYAYAKNPNYTFEKWAII